MGSGQPAGDRATHQQVMAPWDTHPLSLRPVANRPPYPYVDQDLRKVARDASVSRQGSRYWVPWHYAGRQVWVRNGSREVEVLYGRQPIAVHARAQRQHAVVTRAQHRQGIPLGAAGRGSKIVVHIRDAPTGVEIRPLAACQCVAAGPGR